MPELHGGFNMKRSFSITAYKTENYDLSECAERNPLSLSYLYTSVCHESTVDSPGVVSQGDTIEEIIDNMKEPFELYCEENKLWVDTAEVLTGAKECLNSTLKRIQRGRPPLRRKRIIKKRMEDKQSIVPNVKHNRTVQYEISVKLPEDEVRELMFMGAIIFVRENRLKRLVKFIQNKIIGKSKEAEEDESYYYDDFPNVPLPITHEMVETSMLEAAAERLIGVCAVFNSILKKQTLAEREIEVGKIGFELKDEHGQEFLKKVIAIIEIESPHTQLVVVDIWKNLKLLD